MLQLSKRARIKCFGLQFSVSHCGHSRARFEMLRNCLPSGTSQSSHYCERSNVPSKFSLYRGYFKIDERTMTNLDDEFFTLFEIDSPSIEISIFACPLYRWVKFVDS